MPRLFPPVRARARWLALPALFFYLCTLTLVTFGHRCGVPEAAASPRASARAAQRLAKATALAQQSPDDCPACTWQRDAAGASVVQPQPGLTLRQRHETPLVRSARVLTRTHRRAPPRGPPSA